MTASKVHPELPEKPPDVKNEPPKFSPLARQIFLSSGTTVLAISGGATAAFSAILLPQLQEPNSPIQITETEYSWIASITVLSMAIGCSLGSYLMERFGRKYSQLIGAVPCFAGWLLIYLSNNIPTLLAGRLLKGLSSGILAPPSNVYLGEACDPTYRAFLLSSLTLAVTLGLLGCHLLGTFLSWKTTALLNCAVPIVGFVLLLFAPESPSWLTKKGKLEKAERKFYWCRGNSPKAVEEMAAMLQRHIDEGRSNGLKDLLKGRFLKPLGIIVTFLAATQFTGMNAITFYSVKIMKDTVGDGLNEYTAMLIIDTVRVVASSIACILLRRVGRRPLGLISGIGCTISLLSLSLFLYLPTQFPSLSKFSPISVFFLMSYVSFVMIGLMPLPWTMVGELFPLNAREYGSGIASTMSFLSMFVVVKSSPFLFSGIGVAATFLLYGCVALAETIFLLLVLPETKGKTLQEIEDTFRRKKGKAEEKDKIGIV